MIELRGVSKNYAGHCVLQPTDLTIERGQTTVLIGQSGSGKSTLLRIIMGLITPDEGTVTFDGTLLCRDNCQLLRRKMGYVIQDGGLFPHLSAMDNALLLGRYLKINEGTLEARVEELIQLTKLPSKCLEQFPGQLSGGQRQRVSLMRALVLDPEVLLLDEPMGALDPMIRCELQSDLKAIFKSLKKTVVLVTHDLGEACFLGDSIALMRDGHIVQEGSFDNLVGHPEDPFVTNFINAQRPPQLLNGSGTTLYV